MQIGLGLSSPQKLYPQRGASAAHSNVTLNSSTLSPIHCRSNLRGNAALEEEEPMASQIDDAAIRFKVGMMGPLAGIGDPVFLVHRSSNSWGDCCLLATGGSILAPLFFFVVWDTIRVGFSEYTWKHQVYTKRVLKSPNDLVVSCK